MTFSRPTADDVAKVRATRVEDEPQPFIVEQPTDEPTPTTTEPTN